MSLVNAQSLRGRGPATQRAGHVYVLRFANDELKVGRSSKLAQRIHDHKREAHKRGNPITEHWTSPEHPDSTLVEDTLIGWCMAQGGATRLGFEWFAGLDYAATVAQATLLCEPGAVSRGQSARPPRPVAPSRRRVGDEVPA